MNSCMTNYDATGSGKTCFSFTLNLFINAKGPLEPNFEKYLHSKTYPKCTDSHNKKQNKLGLTWVIKKKKILVKKTLQTILQEAVTT